MRLIDADLLKEQMESVCMGIMAGTDSYIAPLKTIDDAPTIEAVEVVRCKECKHFEYDHPYIIQGIPVLGHEVCNAWGDGCKTDENGYCFMAERREDKHGNRYE